MSLPTSRLPRSELTPRSLRVIEAEYHLDTYRQKHWRDRSIAGRTAWTGQRVSRSDPIALTDEEKDAAFRIGSVRQGGADGNELGKTLRLPGAGCGE